MQELASAVGYFPQFAFLSSLNNLVDLASVGLIGQKAGFTSTVQNQLKSVRISSKRGTGTSANRCLDPRNHRDRAQVSRRGDEPPTIDASRAECNAPHRCRGA